MKYRNLDFIKWFITCSHDIALFSTAKSRKEMKYIVIDTVTVETIIKKLLELNN